MKTISLVLLFSVVSLFVNAQNLELDEWIVREGETFTLKVLTDNLQDQLTEQLPEGIDFSYRRVNPTQTAVAELALEAERAGTYSFGPFNLVIGGQEVTTDELKIEVRPALNEEEHLVVNVIERDGEQYLILEQYLEGSNLDEEDFASIDEDAMTNALFTFRSSMRTTRLLTDNIDYTFSRSAYHIRKVDEELALNNQILVNAPTKIVWETFKVVR